MKFCAGPAWFAGIIFFFAVLAAYAQRIDPATGQPAPATANASPINPATGLPASDHHSLSASDREFFNKVAHADIEMYGWPAYKVDGMIISGQYDEALRDTSPVCSPQTARQRTGESARADQMVCPG